MALNPENYIVIQGFMITELNLKGVELILYALIYGFTQDGESEFSGSLSYMCEWANCSKPTVTAALTSLLDKGYITKRQEVISGVKFNRYKAALGGSKKTLLLVKNLYGGSKDSLLGGSKKTLPNNICLYNTNDKIVKENIIKENFSAAKIQKEFNELWKMYPRKLGKDKALSAYIKARKEGTPKEAVEQGLRNYAEYIRTNKVEERYIKHGATWFNQHCWEDEYENIQDFQQNPDAYDISKW